MKGSAEVRRKVLEWAMRVLEYGREQRALGCGRSGKALESVESAGVEETAGIWRSGKVWRKC